MKPKKELEILEKRLKAVEDALGLGNGPAKNIQLLLETIRVQGDEIGNMHRNQEIMHSVLVQRDQYMKEKNLYDDFKTWIESRNKKETDPALEKKEKTPQPPAATDTGRMIERKETVMDEKKEKQIVTKDKSEDAKTAIADSKKEVVNDK